MFIRNYKGDIVFFNTEEYNNETDMYRELWKQLYNITIKEDAKNIKKKMIDYVISGKNMYNL